MNLANTCQRLMYFYWDMYLVNLDMSRASYAQFKSLWTYIERGKRIQKIILNKCARSAADVTDIISDTIPERQRCALRIKNLNLRAFTRHALVPIESVRIIVRMFSELEHLDLSYTRMFVGNDALVAIVHYLSHSLLTLNLSHTNNPQHELLLTDAGGALIGRLYRLNSLSLSNCPQLTEGTFNTLGTLTELEKLDLSLTTISGETMISILPNFTKLAVLILNNCRFITSSILGHLPSSLEELDLNFSSALDGEIPQNVLPVMPKLTRFQGNNCRFLFDLEFLTPVASQLELLYLSGLAVQDELVAPVISQMRNLIQLDLSGSQVSDETATALATLGNIRRAFLSRTNIGDEGVKELLEGVASNSLEFLDLRECPEIDPGSEYLMQLTEAVEIVLL